MDFFLYQKAVRRTMNDKHPLKYRLANWGLGLCGEAGEVGEILKKHVFHGHELDEAALIKELGDELWHLAAISNDLGLDLEEIAIKNIAKLQERYPDGFSEEDSQNRGV